MRVVGEVGLQQAGEELHWRKLLQLEGRFSRQPRQFAKDLQRQGTDGRAGYVPGRTTGAEMIKNFSVLSEIPLL